MKDLFVDPENDRSEVPAPPRMKRLEFTRFSDEVQTERARTFLGEIRRRRTVRHFSDEPVPIGVCGIALPLRQRRHLVRTSSHGHSFW